MGSERKISGSDRPAGADEPALIERALDRGSHLFDMQIEENLSDPELRERVISASEGELGPYISDIWEGYRRRSSEWNEKHRGGGEARVEETTKKDPR